MLLPLLLFMPLSSIILTLECILFPIHASCQVLAACRVVEICSAATLLAVAVLLCRESFHTLVSAADLARVRSSKPTAPVWSAALFNHLLFERNVMRIVAGFAVSEFSEGACLLICAVSVC